MPRGSHAVGGLRSHRRRIGKHLVIAPWIIIVVVAVVLVAGMSAGWAYLVTRGCTGSPITATIAADPTISKTIDSLGRQWYDGGPAMHGRCINVEVTSKESADTASALSPTWNQRTDGQRPDVWVPSSTTWMRMAQTRQDAARMLPDKQPSLARSPTVLAMPMPMAKALGWPKTQVTWSQLTSLSGSGWADHGHPEWGTFKLALSDASRTTSGLNAMLSVADANNDGQISTSERQSLSTLWSKRSEYDPDTDGILANLSKADGTGSAKALQDVSAFPALEQDVLTYNQTQPQVPLAAVYPTDGGIDADFPYLTLNWSHAETKPADQAAQRDRDQVAAQFLTYLRGPAGHKAFQDSGYRDANRRPGGALTPSNGITATVPTLPHTAMAPDAVSQVVSTWAAISQPSTTLLVMDVSQKMGSTVPGTGRTEAQLVGGAAADAVGLFGSQSQVGLWGYASGLAGGKDYQEMVPVGPIDGSTDNGTRRQAVTSDLRALDTGGQAGLYSTTQAAYTAARNHYAANQVNRVVIVSGGTPDNGHGPTLDALTAQLGKLVNKSQPIPVMTIGYGEQTDLAPLQAISAATGGRTYAASTPSEIGKVMLTALFGTASQTN